MFIWTRVSDKKKSYSLVSQNLCYKAIQNCLLETTNGLIKNLDGICNVIAIVHANACNEMKNIKQNTTLSEQIQN